MKDRYLAFLRDSPPLGDLRAQYPDWYSEVRREMAAWEPSAVAGNLKAAVEAARAHERRIADSGLNPKVLEASFPKLVKARMLVLLLRNEDLRVRTGVEGRVRFNRFNAAVLQKLLFRGSGFERKPVSLFWYSLWWPWLPQRRFLMPLVNKKGIYCFYSRPLVRALARKLQGLRCVEVAAGDGTLSRFLSDEGIDIKATDDRSWAAFVDYPEEVEPLDARAALAKYAPEAVLCSWPPAGNAFERHIFECASVRLYIVIAGADAGNPEVYARQSAFDQIVDAGLSRLVLPREDGNQVRVFTRQAAAGDARTASSSDDGENDGDRDSG